VIVVGGGSFGAVFAQHFFFQDSTHSHRVLLLEGGPLTIPEHVQNLPVFAGLNVPGATSIQDLRNQGQFGLDQPREEVWDCRGTHPQSFQGSHIVLAADPFTSAAGVRSFSTKKCRQIAGRRP